MNNVTKQGVSQVPRMEGEFLRAQGLESQLHITFANQPSDDQLRQVADAISFKLAFAHGSWELIHGGALLPCGSPEVCRVSVGYKSSRQGSSWSFPELTYSVPSKVCPCKAGYGRTPLVDGDLFLESLGITTLHEGIEEALREAVRCFRYDLLTSALAMLAAAAEGVWIELARTLTASVGDHHKGRTVGRILEADFLSFMKLVTKTYHLLEDRSVVGATLEAAGVRPHEIREAVEWTRRVSDSRNALHWTYDPEFPNTHEKVSMLMLATAPALRTLERLRHASGSIPEGVQGLDRA